MGAPWRLRGYTVERLLGTGATGEVWRARVAGSGDAVALKRVRVRDAAQAQRALSEAALLTALDHPHLVRLHALVPADGAAVLVLDLADGGSLAQLLAARGRLTPGEVITAIAPVAAALSYLHDEGVVHGDVSPANILFTDAGVPLLADVGVARLVGDDRVVDSTPAYVDPSVAAGCVPGPRSDVFMLGAVALHALTGAPPWPGPDAGDALAAAAAGRLGDLAAQLRGAGVPDPMARVVRRALELDPHRRGTAADLALDLRHSGEPVAVELAAGRSRPEPVAGVDGAPPPRGSWSDEPDGPAVSGPAPSATLGREPAGPAARVARRVLRRSAAGPADAPDAPRGPRHAARPGGASARDGAAPAPVGGDPLTPARRSRHLPPDPADSRPARDVPSAPGDDRAARSGPAPQRWAGLGSGLGDGFFGAAADVGAAGASAGARAGGGAAAGRAGGAAGAGPAGGPGRPAGSSSGRGVAPAGVTDRAGRRDAQDPARPAFERPSRVASGAGLAPPTRMVGPRPRPVIPRPAPRGRRRPALLGALAVAVLALLGTAGTVWASTDAGHVTHAGTRSPGVPAGSAAAGSRQATGPDGAPTTSGVAAGRTATPTAGSPGGPATAPTRAAPDGRTTAPGTATRAGPTDRGGAGDAGTAWPAGGTASEWARVLGGLDAVRARAFATRDPAVLGRVYASAALRAADTALLRRIVPTGCVLLGARTTYRDVTPAATGAGETVTATATLAASRLVCHGADRGTAPGVGPARLRIRLVRVGDEARIAEQHRR